MTYVDGEEVDYSGLPKGLQAAMKRYVEDRIKPGSFLCAVLQNDLKNAVFMADDSNREHLWAIVMWLNWNAPQECFGGITQFTNWLGQ